MKIGVFDSGVGGLNVLKELIKAYPNNEYIYYGDTKNVPYGNKSKDELFNLSMKIVRFFEEKAVDLIIIGCGTVSSNCYLDICKNTKIKVLDIINPTINYINTSNFKNIGVIGTTKTIESCIFQKLINKLVIAKDTPKFVPFIENDLIIENKNEVISDLELFKNKVDCLILGCTHYPLLSDIISEYLNINLINMGECLVNSLSLTNNSTSKITLYFSLLNDNIISNIHKIIPFDKEIIEL